MVKTSMREAWFSIDGKEWDAAIGAPGQNMVFGEDPWDEQSTDEIDRMQKARETWDGLPDNEKAWLYSECIIPYADILLIDDVGDDYFEGSHLFVRAWTRGYPLARYYIETIEHRDRRTLKISGPKSDGRVVKFPGDVRDYHGPMGGY